MEIKSLPYGYSLYGDDDIYVLYKGKHMVVARFSRSTEYEEIVAAAEEHAAKKEAKEPK